MEINRDEITDVTIRRLERQELRIGDEVFTQHVALTADRIFRDWPGTPVEKMRPEDFDELLAAEPEMIVVGGGFGQVQPQKHLVFEMARRGIGIEFMDTPAAARTFNILVAEGRRAAAVLLLDH